MDDILILAAILCGVTIVAVFVNKRLLTLLLSSVFMLLVAMRLSIPSMYLMGAVLLALPAASYAIGRFGVLHLQVRLKAPETVFEGETAAVRVDVQSPLSVFSALARPRFELPHWLTPVAGSDTTEPIPGGLRREFRLLAERRGVYSLSLGSVLMNDPLGIFTLSRRFPQTDSLTVYPVGLSRDLVLSLGHSRAGWLLQASTGRRGDEDGFYGTREYRVGDDLRRIHWRTSARYGGLVIAERETSSAATIWVCLDTFRQAYGRQEDSAVLEQAVKTAVSIMEAALRNGNKVGLLAPGETGKQVPPSDTEDQRWLILDALAHVTASGDVPLGKALMDLGVPTDGTVVLLTPAPTRGVTDAMSRLASNGVNVTLIVVDGEGGEPAIDGGALIEEGLRVAAAAGADTLRIPAV